jgi:hypothetical protein
VSPACFWLNQACELFIFAFIGYLVAVFLFRNDGTFYWVKPTLIFAFIGYLVAAFLFKNDRNSLLSQAHIGPASDFSLEIQPFIPTQPSIESREK